MHISALWHRLPFFCSRLQSSLVPKHTKGIHGLSKGREVLAYVGEALAISGAAEPWIRAELGVCQEKWGRDSSHALPGLAITGKGIFSSAIPDALHLLCACMRAPHTHRNPKKPTIHVIPFISTNQNDTKLCHFLQNSYYLGCLFKNKEGGKGDVSDLGTVQ